MEEVVAVDKRKRSEDGEIDGKEKVKVMMMSEAGAAESEIKSVDDEEKKKKKAVVSHDREGNVEDEDDGEVEEFFAILKRIRVAVKYFEEGDVDGRRRQTTTSRPWNPRFEREDFEGLNVVKEGAEENAVLDLNADPVDS